MGARLFRNQVGVYRLEDGRVIASGLAKGSSDLIGWVTIGGRAIFCAIEVKTAKGRLREHQRKFIEAVIRHGGVAGVCRCVEDLAEILRQARIDRA